MEPLAFFLSVFTALADRIEKFKSTKFLDRKEFFNEIIKPVFIELEPVASNYINIFRTIRKSIDKSSLNSLQTILEEITKEREIMLISRIKVEQMAKQIKEHIKDKDIEAFADSVLLFFYGATKQPGVSRTVMLIRSLEYIQEQNYSEEESYQIEYIRSYAADVLQDLENKWKQIVIAYEKIKLFSTTPLRLLKSRR